MKIAVASSDGIRISPHFGRSPYFLVLDIQNGEIVGKELRSNTFTHQAHGECHGDGQHDHGASSHITIVEALHDCGAVLCYRMGARAAEALGQAGVQSYTLGKKCTPESAVALLLEGKLQPVTHGLCQCND